MKPSAEVASYDVCKKITSYLQSRTRHRPVLGIVIGSGLSQLANTIQEQVVFNYKDIEGFPVTAGSSQKGRLIFGVLCGKTVVCMQGRAYTYEGFEPAECALPIRIMKLLGVDTLVLANAAGGLNGDYKTGDIMIITDHICLPALTGNNPFIGPNDERFGSRFPDMVNCYSTTYTDLIKLSAARLSLGWRVRQGVYVMISGPAYSTHAENRFLRLCGGDAVGMSNCWEVMAARQCGMKVLALCVITDTFRLLNGPIDIRRDGAVDGTKQAASDLTKLLLETIPML